VLRAWAAGAGCQPGSPRTSFSRLARGSVTTGKPMSGCGGSRYREVDRGFRPAVSRRLWRAVCVLVLVQMLLTGGSVSIARADGTTLPTVIASPRSTVTGDATTTTTPTPIVDTPVTGTPASSIPGPAASAT